jgi:hypothetical protein
VEELTALLERAYTPQQTLTILVEIVKHQFDLMQAEQRNPAPHIQVPCIFLFFVLVSE